MEIDQDTNKLNMADLLNQSHEVLHLILSHVDPVDLGPLRESCKSLDSFIRNNNLLWKEQYLSKWVCKHEQHTTRTMSHG